MSQREDSSLNLKSCVKLARFKGLPDISYFTIQLRNLNLLLRDSKVIGNHIFYGKKLRCVYCLSQMSLTWYLFI